MTKACLSLFNESYSDIHTNVESVLEKLTNLKLTPLTPKYIQNIQHDQHIPEISKLIKILSKSQKRLKYPQIFKCPKYI